MAAAGAGGRSEKEGRSCSSHAEGVLTHEEVCHGTGYPPSQGGDEILLERGPLASGMRWRRGLVTDPLRSFAFGGWGYSEEHACRDGSGESRGAVSDADEEEKLRSEA